MNKITLISPYFGKEFSPFFSVLVDSMINNPNINFVIPTNLPYKENGDYSNILFVRTDLHYLNNEIDSVLGYHARIDSPYKLVDFRPAYGTIFSKYIGNSDWWGYFDSDIIFGNISEFLTDDLLDMFDRVFTHGHLTLFRNNNTMNSLWNKNFNLPEVPSFKEVSTSKAIFAFDEWGWGKNKGRGISYALSNDKSIRQYDNNSWFADIIKDKFEFNTTSGENIDYFRYNKGNLAGYANNTEIKYLYVHFQKRSMINRVSSTELPIYITPNILDTKKNENQAELKRWISYQKDRKIHQKIANLNYWYLKRRLRFWHTEK